MSGTPGNDTGWGWFGAAALEYVLLPQLGLQLEISNVSLSAGKTPKDPTIEPKGDSSAQAALLGARFRPFAKPFVPDSEPLFSAEGLWLAAAVGGAKTGDFGRPLFDVHLGFDVLSSGFGVGPFVGYSHVFQDKKALRPDDANLVLFGVHGVIGLPKKVVVVPTDRDNDGIYDNDDQCPDQPEDKDGFEDQDGCPDVDNDKDNIPDVTDACPNEPGPTSPDPKANGCPVRDRDKDGIPDSADKCPDEPEDKDGFEDEDGCPDPDNDKDGILDPNDKCPNEAEVFNGYADDDGCPDDAQVRVVGDKMLLDDRVQFDTNKAVVLTVSYPLLQRVGRLINSHPEYTHVEVAGYADERGTEAFNQKLSEDRAKAVMDVLVKIGKVDPKRLSAVGYGTANPRVAESNEKAWRENRRTEFTITRENKQMTYTDFPGANAVDKAGGAAPVTAPKSGSEAEPAKAGSGSETEPAKAGPGGKEKKGKKPAQGGARGSGSSSEADKAAGGGKQ